MAKGKKNTQEEAKPDTGAWMITFTDLLMLMLTFFVLLLTMSSMDAQVLKDIRTQLRGAVGLLEYSGLREIRTFRNFVEQYSSSSDLFVVNQDLLENLLSSSALEKHLDRIKKDYKEMINISDDERGIVFSFPEKILFEPGKVKITESFYHILDEIALAIDSTPNNILIMGHADDAPTGSKLYESNWELSANRGLSILDYFTKKKTLSPSRFSVGGYGQSRPLYSKDTPKNKAMNRRVEIIFRHFIGD